MKKIYLFFIAIALFQNAVTAQLSFSNRNDLMQNTHFHSGVAIGISDMNNDKLDDIIHLSQGVNLQLEYQTSNGIFGHYTVGNVAASSIWSMCVGDVDNNGYNDVLTGGDYDGVKVTTANSDGTAYTTNTLNGPSIFLQGSNFADINNDGWLDAFGCHDDEAAKIWTNDGTGNLSISAIINMVLYPSPYNSGNYGSEWTDFDNDGDLDLYVAKCRQGVNDPADLRRINLLYVNDGNNNYTEQAAAYGLAIGAQSWTADLNDIDNDGDLDMFITNHDVPSMILENDGTGHFTDITATSGVSIHILPLQGVMRDFDNDGYVDILFAGEPSGPVQHFYHNNGDKTFTEVSNLFGGSQMESFAIGDLNHDGFLDVYGGYANVYTTPSSIDDVIWMNGGNSNHFFAINLVGTISNRNAAGARVTLYSALGTQIREVRSGESYGIHNTFTQHFGMGSYTQIDSVTIRWPSGIRQTIVNPSVDQFMTVQENGCISPEAIVTLDGPTTICNGQTVTLTAPEGYNYLWSNGETTQSISVSAAGSYNVIITDGTSTECKGISKNINITINPEEIPSISVQGDTTFCSGGSVVLTSSPSSSYHWSNNETSQSITVTESGDYIVTTQGLCAQFNSLPVHVDVKASADVPVVQGDTVTVDNPATLYASGNDVHWYDLPVGGNLITTGNTYVTPPLAATTTYYVEDVNHYAPPLQNAGQPDHQGTEYGGNQYNGQIIFDCTSPFILKRVKVITDLEGTRTIELQNQSLAVVASKQVTLPVGTSVIDLDFAVTPGTGYILTSNTASNLANFGYNSPRFQRSDVGVLYPYSIPGVLSMTGSNLGSNRYYYFYNWEVQLPDLDCYSPREPIVASVEAVSGSNTPQDGYMQIHPNPANGMATVDFRQVIPGQSALVITDLKGDLVYRSILKAGEQNCQIDTHGFAKGMYIVQVLGDQASWKTKLVVQ